MSILLRCNFFQCIMYTVTSSQTLIFSIYTLSMQENLSILPCYIPYVTSFQTLFFPLSLNLRYSLLFRKILYSLKKSNYNVIWWLFMKISKKLEFYSFWQKLWNATKLSNLNIYQCTSISSELLLTHCPSRSTKVIPGSLSWSRSWIPSWMSCRVWSQHRLVENYQGSDLVCLVEDWYLLNDPVSDKISVYRLLKNPVFHPLNVWDVFVLDHGRDAASARKCSACVQCCFSSQSVVHSQGQSAKRINSLLR